MDVELTTSGRVEVYDLQTRFATSSGAPGMKVLCQLAISNGDRIDQDSVMNQYNMNEAAARNLITDGFESGVWDSDGVLSEDGHETAQSGEILLPEVGPLRIWIFDHETTGAVLLHAERLGLLPPADVNPQAGNAPDVFHRLSNGKAVKSLKSGDKRRWRLQWTDEESAWAIVETYCAKAQLSWSWRYEDEWILDDEIILKGILNGTSRKKSEDGISVDKKYPHTGALNPDVCIREWLTGGRFTSGPWDSKLNGLKRPFSDMTDAEKSLQTTDEVLDSEAEGWDRISIREIPLFAKNLDDGTDWSIHLINEETPGYTTTEDTQRKLRDILERPFMCLDGSKVRERVEKKLASSRGDPRLSKLLHAGDDLDAIALIPEWVLAQKRDETRAVHDGSGDYTEFVKQLSQKMKGDIHQVMYVDRYTVNSNVRKKLSKFNEAISEQIPSAQFDILTAHHPYSKNHEDAKSAAKSFQLKLEKICDHAYFMDAGLYGEESKRKKIAHDRTIIIRSNSETRWWKITTAGITPSIPIPCVRVEERDVEPLLIQHLKETESKNKKEASA